LCRALPRKAGDAGWPMVGRGTTRGIIRRDEK
jgi:hypothetical protein